jgi:hypothetical protein
MVKFKTKTHLILEGAVIQPGNEVEIDPKKIDVDRLVKLDAIELVEEVEETEETEEVEEEKEEKPKKKAKENPGK